MDLQFLVDRLEALVVNARKLPMTSQVILEQGAVLDFVDQMRTAIPEEVRQARRINQEAEKVIANAKEEADHIIAAAQEQAALLLQEHEVSRRARDRQDEIVGRAEAQAEETMRGADQYAADVLRRLESDLERTLATVRSYVTILEQRLDGHAGEARDEDQRRAVAEAAVRGDRVV